MKLLLLSNSSNYGEGYLQFGKRYIHEFIAGDRSNILFIPYAAVTISWDEYEAKVISALSEAGITIKSLHHFNDPIKEIKKASCIIVRGGNTFHLLAQLYILDLLTTIKDLVIHGIPYLGWSAGSNIACPTIQTTNDMPVENPGSFNALSLIPFQINPHYTDATIAGHNGESRADRLKEFVAVNKNSLVVGLPEGMIIETVDHKYRLVGNKGVMIFRYGSAPEYIDDTGKFNQIINSFVSENSHLS